MPELFELSQRDAAERVNLSTAVFRNRWHRIQPKREWPRAQLRQIQRRLSQLEPKLEQPDGCNHRQALKAISTLKQRRQALLHPQII
jgi:hypothetical protein